MKWAGRVAVMGEEKCLQLLVDKPEGKRRHGRHWRRWEDNVNLDLQKAECGALTGSMWLMMGEVAVTCEYTDEHSGSIKGRKCLDQPRNG